MKKLKINISLTLDEDDNDFEEEDYNILALEIAEHLTRVIKVYGPGRVDYELEDIEQ